MPNTFGKYLHFFSCTLIFIGFSAILVTGSYLVPVSLGALSTLAYMIFGEKLIKYSLPKSAWNLLAILLFVYLTYQSFYGDSDLVGNAISLVVYLQIVKILSPKDNRDWFQIYLLSFLHVLASTTISSDMSFALPFLAYLVMATWTLTLFNIKLQQESATSPHTRERVLKKLFNSKDIVTRRFFATTLLLSVFVIIVSLVIFFIFPRVSMKNFLRRVSVRQDIAGFGGEVELGTIGKIKSDNTIALRVELPQNTIDKIDIEELYWRGTSSDHFDGKKWSQSISDRKPLYIDMDDNILKTKLPQFPGGKLLEYNVFLEALSTPIMFGADRMIRVVWDKPFVEKFLRRTLSLDHSDEYQGYYFQTSQNFSSDLTYRAESMIGEPSPELLRKDEKNYSIAIKNTYLQLPDLDPNVVKLLDSIPMDNASTYDRVMSIQRFLENNYAYTINVQDIGTENPMRHFFLERKRGHCGYFSTAMIVALRHHGIPARQVIGFRGGEFNAIGNYLAIRQNNAHGWVEVYFSKYGWVRFDPSPPNSDSDNRQSTALKSFLQMTDYLRLRWNKYIIEYDLRSQAGFIEKIGKRFSDTFRDKNQKATIEKDEDITSNAKTTSISLWKLGKYPLIISVIFFVYLFFRRQRRQIISHIYYRNTLRLLKKHGFSKSTSETPWEFCLRIEKHTGTNLPLETIVSMYYEERFGSASYDLIHWNKAFAELKSTMHLSKKKKVLAGNHKHPVE